MPSLIVNETGVREQNPREVIDGAEYDGAADCENEA